MKTEHRVKIGTEVFTIDKDKTEELSRILTTEGYRAVGTTTLTDYRGLTDIKVTTTEYEKEGGNPSYPLPGARLNTSEASAYLSKQQ